jgi:hypothetical protein
MKFCFGYMRHTGPNMLKPSKPIPMVAEDKVMRFSDKLFVTSDKNSDRNFGSAI